MHLHTILDKLLAYAERTQPDIRSVMQPGLDATTIRARVPLVLPDDVVALYQWQNGMRDEERMEEHTLFYYHHFLSLEHALDIYLELRQIDEEIGGGGYLPELFPIFTFMGEYYAVWTGMSDDDFGSIYFDYHGEGKVYDSLTRMLTAILECYDTGAYAIQNNTVVPDEPRVAQIKAKWNACRVLEDGTTLNYHP